MITIGADPEVFLQTNEGIPVSSIGKIGGTKYEPMHIQNGIFLQEDNVTVEYNIPPCESAEKFIEYNTQALDIITERAKKMNLLVSIKAAHKMPKEELKDPRSWVFGCEPDFNVWKMEDNPKPIPNQWRAAGGHVHIGFEGTNIDKVNLTKYLDSTLGALFSLLDPDDKRKKMYGTAGSLRFKDYGIEYRTLSNYWLSHPLLTKVVFDTAYQGANLIQQSKLNQVELPKKIIDAINRRKVSTLIEYLSLITQRGMTPLSFRTAWKATQQAITHREDKQEIDQKKLYRALDEQQSDLKEQQKIVRAAASSLFQQL